MAQVTGVIVIDRPVDLVFDFVADERNEPLYNRHLLRSEMVTPGPIGLGSRFRAFHSQGHGDVEMAIEYTGYVRPRRLSSKTTMSWAEVDGALTFAPKGAATELRWAWDVRPKGAARILTPFIGPIGRRTENACWEGLKRYLEHGGGGG
ncbi:MAG: SRPBCC family protein [Acidobacteriota bacterium]|nr:SRPBCC family protein [Acidobacteriota bacterium]